MTCRWYNRLNDSIPERLSSGQIELAGHSHLGFLLTPMLVMLWGHFAQHSDAIRPLSNTSKDPQLVTYPWPATWPVGSIVFLRSSDSRKSFLSCRPWRVDWIDMWWRKSFYLKKLTELASTFGSWAHSSSSHLIIKYLFKGKTGGTWKEQGEAEPEASAAHFPGEVIALDMIIIVTPTILIIALITIIIIIIQQEFVF